MRLVREAQGLTEGLTITYRGAPVAVLRGYTLPNPASSAATGFAELPGDKGEPSELACGDGWTVGGPLGGSELEPTDDDAALDSASWGRWDAMSEPQRRALLEVIKEHNGGEVARR
jgi:hypothetical protein